MTSYRYYEINEKDRVGSRFISAVHHEIMRAFTAEKTHRKINQQQIASKLGVNRSVINRQLRGLENMTARSIAELLWAMGWEPEFTATKPSVDVGANASTSTDTGTIEADVGGNQSNSALTVDEVVMVGGHGR